MHLKKMIETKFIISFIRSQRNYYFRAIDLIENRKCFFYLVNQVMVFKVFQEGIVFFIPYWSFSFLMTS